MSPPATDWARAVVRNFNDWFRLKYGRDYQPGNEDDYDIWNTYRNAADAENYVTYRVTVKD